MCVAASGLPWGEERHSTAPLTPGKGLCSRERTDQELGGHSPGSLELGFKFSLLPLHVGITRLSLPILQSDCEGHMGVLVGLCKAPKGTICCVVKTGLEVGFATHSGPFSHGTRQHPLIYLGLF